MAANKEYIRRHKSWQKHAEEKLAKGKRPTKFKDWQIQPTYFKALNRQSIESRLKSAGLTESELSRFRKKK